jgi:hypothetical protein
MWKLERRIRVYLEIQNTFLFYVIFSTYLTVQKLKSSHDVFYLRSRTDVHTGSTLYFSHTEVLKCFLEFVSTAFRLRRRRWKYRCLRPCAFQNNILFRNTYIHSV